MDPAERILWQQLVNGQREPARRQLMERYLPLVRKIAAAVHRRLRGQVELEELEQDGVFGLDRAIDGFDLARGLAFSTYAGKPIFGAIMDAVRDRDWVPRLTRQREKAGLLTATRMSSLENVVTESGKAKVLLDYLEDHGQRPGQVLEEREAFGRLLTGMSRAERMTLMLYYGPEALTMKEIGRSLGISESRVSQVHSLALEQLKARLTMKSDEQRYVEVLSTSERQRWRDLFAEEPPAPPVGKRSCADGIPERTVEEVEEYERQKLQRIAALTGGSVPEVIGPHNQQETAMSDETMNNGEAVKSKSGQRGNRLIYCVDLDRTMTVGEASVMCGASTKLLAQTCTPSSQAKGGRCAGHQWRWAGAPAVATVARAKPAKPAPAPQPAATNADPVLRVVVDALVRGQGGQLDGEAVVAAMAWLQGVQDVLAGRADLVVRGGVATVQRGEAA